MFRARLPELRAMRAFLERFCDSSGVNIDNCLRLNLVLEELFTNTIRHGYGGDCDEPVWVSLTREPGRVSLVYEDTAPPFNPYRKLPSVAADSIEEVRKLGGLGVLLTKKLAASRDYAYLFGRNRIRLTFELAR
jgi:anti-sigma regulatory factor (Ser/Thr protein kinase)